MVANVSVQIGRPGQFEDFRRFCEERLQKALLRATDRAAREATNDIRSAMQSAGLGRLSKAIGSGSDQRKGRGAHREGGGFSASGWLHVRGRSERTLGALEAYTEGAEISPRRSRFLWIATDEIPSRVGRNRMTPELYNRSGLPSRIGRLVQVPGRHGGEALLIVRNVTVDRFGRKGRARRLPRRGGVRPTREQKAFIVAFVGVRNTRRAARLNPAALLEAASARLGALLAEETQKEMHRG